jgi:hypothetical protein
MFKWLAKKAYEKGVEDGRLQVLEEELLRLDQKRKKVGKVEELCYIPQKNETATLDLNRLNEMCLLEELA